MASEIPSERLRNAVLTAFERRSNGVRTQEQEQEQQQEREQEPTQACARDTGQSNDFGVFWAAYPRKVGKDAAKKAFERRRSVVDLEVLLAALELQVASQQWQRDGGRYVPHPATWLNQGRWQDEVDQSGNALSEAEWKQAAEIRRKSYGRCPHEQPCTSYEACVTTIGMARRVGVA
jgi:hypothetical protein